MKPALYRIGVVLLLTIGVAGAGIPSAAGSTRHVSRPCGEVTSEYSAARARPGDATDMDLIVNNCSHRLERLRVHARSHGPCPFPHPVDHTYILPAQAGVGEFALVLLPSCPGRYSVHLKLTLAGHHPVLDVASDGFVIHQLKNKIRSLPATRGRRLRSDCDHGFETGRPRGDHPSATGAARMPDRDGLGDHVARRGTNDAARGDRAGLDGTDHGHFRTPPRTAFCWS